MCRTISAVTTVALLLPAVLIGIVFFAGPAALAPALLVVAIYVWVWLRFRPLRFVVGPAALEIVWPLKRRRIERSRIRAVRLVDRRALRQELGRCTRVGAGGLWGGFGWLWTSRRGIVQMYISRVDDLVWIDTGGGRPWLITPERPEAFIPALAG